MPDSFFLTKNQAFQYDPSKSFKTSLLKRSCIIFITFRINAWGSGKFGAYYALCGIVFKTTRGETSSWNRLHLGYLKEITSFRLSIILSNNTFSFGRSISPTSKLTSLSEVNRVPRGIAKNQGKSKCWYFPICCCGISWAFKCSYQSSLPLGRSPIPLALSTSYTFLAFNLYIVYT